MITALKKTLFLFSLLLVYGSASKFQAYRHFDQYDDLFKQYSAEQFGAGFDWRYFKAQAIAESRLKKKAQSHDGAMGIMQILPAELGAASSETREYGHDIFMIRKVLGRRCPACPSRFQPQKRNDIIPRLKKRSAK